MLYSMVKDDRGWHIVSVDTILKAQYSYATLEQGPELVIVDGDKYIFTQFRTSEMGTAMDDWETYHFQLLELPYGRTFELRFTVSELIYQRLIKSETIYNRWGGCTKHHHR